MADVFGAEGDVAGLLQFFDQLQLDRIRCIRQVAASLQNTSLDDKTIGCGATRKSAWGQNRLFEAPRLRRDRVELDKGTSFTSKPSYNLSARLISDRRPY